MLYEVLAKCGHVGKGKFVEKFFAVEATNGKEAAKIVRNMPRVKHHQKDAIISVNVIGYKRFLEIKCMQENDPYFSCKCIQDQRQYIEENIYDELKEDRKHRKKENSRKDVYVGKIKLRNPKSSFNKIYFEMRTA